MKKIFVSTLLLVATISSFCFSGSVFASSEFIANGGFEEGTAGWNFGQYSGVTQETYNEGTSCLKLGGVEGQGGSTASAEQTVNLFDGAGNYQLTFYYKNMLGYANSLAIPFVLIDGTEKWRASASQGEWLKATINFNAESSRTIISLNSARADNFGIYFDSVSVKRISEFIINGSFEDGSTGWAPLWLSAVTQETSAHSGTSCMKSGGEAGKGGSQGSTSQVLTMPIGTYKLSFWYKNMQNSWNSLARPVIKINNITVYNPANSPGDWMMHTVYFSATENQSITITLSATRADLLGIYYDDVSISPLDTTVSFANTSNQPVQSISQVKGAELKAVISPGGNIGNCKTVLAIYETEENNKKLKEIAVKNISDAEKVNLSFGAGTYIPAFNLPIEVPNEEGKTYIAEVYIWDDFNTMKPLCRRVTLE